MTHFTDSLTTANEERDAAQKEAKMAKKILKKKDNIVKLVPKPRGLFGFETYTNHSGKTVYGYNLQTAMGLAGDIRSDKNNKYNQIVVRVQPLDFEILSVGKSLLAIASRLSF